MRYIKTGVIVIIIGSSIGAVFGVLVMWWGVHRMTAVEPAIGGAAYGTIVGTVGGLVVSIVNRILKSWKVDKVIGGKINEIVGVKITGGIVGTSNGIVIGSIVGAIIEVGIGLARTGAFSITMVYIAAAIGAFVGAIYGIASKTAYKAIDALANGVVCGTILGIVGGLVFQMIWILSMSLAVKSDRRIPVTIEGGKTAITLAIATAVFGILITVMSNAVITTLKTANASETPESL